MDRTPKIEMLSIVHDPDESVYYVLVRFEFEE